jgi:flagellar FliL protein
MAEEETDLEPVAEEPKGGLRKILIFGGIGLVLLIAGVVVGLLVMNMNSGSPDDAPDVAAVDVPAKPALYTSLHPPLIVNFDDLHGTTHFMQITMEVMSRDQSVINAVREHMPVIRNNLILLYGNAIYDEVTTRSGKEKMLADGLAEIQGIMKTQIGEPGVEAVYFTSLIVQ